MKKWLSGILAGLMVWQASISPVAAASNVGMEELLFGDIPGVSVGTKIDMPLSETPGIVTAYSANDMKNLGYYTISELANITPGYSTQSYWGEETLTTRGMKTANFENNKHLLLIDDIPVNFLRQNKVHQGYEFPLFGAEQVEFLRGPASAAYGTGAFYGVVNVRTKELNTNGSSFEARSFGGSLGSEVGQFADMHHTTDAGQSKLNVGYYKRDSSYKTFNERPNRIVWDDQTDVFMNFSYKFRQGGLEGLKFGYTLIRRQTGLGESFYGGGGQHSSELNDIYFLSSFPYLKYDKDLTDKLSLTSYLKVGQGAERGYHDALGLADGDNTTITGTTTLFSAYNKNFREYEGLAQLNYKFRDAATLLGGVNYDYREHSDKDLYIIDRQADPTDVVTSSSSFTLPQANPFKVLGIFGQYTDKFNTFGGGTFVTLGGRFDSDTYGGTEDLPSATVSRFSPRGAIVQKFTDTLSLKLLYGTALRTPSLKEMQAQGETRSKGQPVASELKPETIETTELGLVYAASKLAGSLTAFQITHKDALSSSVVVDPLLGQILSYRNSDGKTKSTGFEVELKGKITSFLQAFGNYSYADAESTGLFTTDPSVDAPKSTLNVGLTASFSRLTASAVVRNVGKYKGHNGTLDSSITPYSSSNFGGHTTTDVITNWKVNEEVSVSLEGRNLGSSYHLPNSDFIQLYSAKGVLVPTNLFRFGLNVKF